MSEFHDIRYEVERGRARITLNRPEKLNAITDRMQRELCTAVWEADDDVRVHAIILRGAGRAFCAGYALGGNVPDREQGPGESHRGMHELDDDAWQLERLQRYRLALFDAHKPVIAQVHGHCMAGGIDLALLCDLVIAADDATFGFPPARDLGTLPTNLWLYHMGPQWAKRLLLTGDTITGAEAAEIGMVLKAVPADRLEAEVEGLADRLARIDPHLLSAQKRVVNLGLEMMGARTMQRLVAELDARAHRAPSTHAFREKLREKGVHTAMAERRAEFGDGRARVRGPEIRDERGHLVD